MAEVSILMCTYNGEKYLKEQLDSFRNQTVSDWELLVSDDGSGDKTLEIIDLFRQGIQNSVHVITGPKKGFASNFLNATKHSSNSSAFFAFSDQDDIWYQNKLELALSWLRRQPSSIPALYCSLTEYVDENGYSLDPPKISRGLPCDPNFANALVQSIAGGNTMVFNRAAKDLLLQCGADSEIASHDWWLYIIVLGVGGVVKFDNHPTLMYRQHSHNLVGGNLGVTAFAKRGLKFLRGHYRELNEKNVKNLERVSSLLTPENKKIFDLYKNSRNGSVLNRCVSLYKSGVRRYGPTSLLLWLGPLLKKI